MGNNALTVVDICRLTTVTFYRIHFPIDEAQYPNTKRWINLVCRPFCRITRSCRAGPQHISKHFSMKWRRNMRLPQLLLIIESINSNSRVSLRRCITIYYNQQLHSIICLRIVLLLYWQLPCAQQFSTILMKRYSVRTVCCTTTETH